GSDLVFLGGLIRYVLENEADFREYVRAYSNASMIVGEDYSDPADLGGLFSGFDAERAGCDSTSRQYEAGTTAPPPGGADPDETDSPERSGSGGPVYPTAARTDPSLSHPRCVYQLLKKHYAEYTPELVEEVCGVPREHFLQVARAIVANSGADRTT